VEQGPLARVGVQSWQARHIGVPLEPFERARHGIAQLVRLLPITAGLRETLGGLLPAHAFGAVPSEAWKRKIEVELTGSFFLFKAVLPRMMAQ
jgi:NAD(P)-dependent dehydrogenase (short-subunit alcohol dehydrogenase family)